MALSSLPDACGREKEREVGKTMTKSNCHPMWKDTGCEAMLSVRMKRNGTEGERERRPGMMQLHGPINSGEQCPLTIAAALLLAAALCPITAVLLAKRRAKLIPLPAILPKCAGSGWLYI
jgi:hypothetical protein